MKNKTKLSQHRFSKGKFITPLNEILNSAGHKESWCYARLPEYLWIGLILDKYDRKIGLESCAIILNKLHALIPKLEYPLFSSILSMDNEKKEEFFEFIKKQLDNSIFAPLTILFTYSQNPIFNKCFFDSTMTIDDRKSLIESVLDKGYMHQSNFATDMRFVVMYFALTSGKWTTFKENIDNMNEYPNLNHRDEKMRVIRPSIRASEVASMYFIKQNKEYLIGFWERISKMSDCKLYGLNYEKKNYQANNYTQLLYEAFEFTSSLFKATSPLDNKMLVLLGMATFSYKNLMEVVEKDLFNAIVGRNVARLLIENFIMMKYLLDEESKHADIWTDYQFYGIGQYKLVLARSRENKNDLSKSHVDYALLEGLVNEYVIEETIDMDTKYFDNKGVRDKAIQVNEKDLFGLYYDYDSAFAHGLWGAIRESSLLKCNNPAHHYHCVPDYTNNQNLKSIWYDCVNVMNKTLFLLNEIYGIPSNIIKEVQGYEKELIDEKAQNNSE